MSLGFVVLDPEGRVVSLNEAARELIPELSGLFTDLKRVDLMALQELLGGRSGESDPPDLEVSLEPLANGSPEPVHLLLSLRARWVDAQHRRRMLTQRYRMTPAELRLAELVMDGYTAAMAAQKLEITIHTIRTYLKRLYAKVGVRNQAGLVRSLLRAERD